MIELFFQFLWYSLEIIEYFGLKESIKQILLLFLIRMSFLNHQPNFLFQYFQKGNLFLALLILSRTVNLTNLLLFEIDFLHFDNCFRTIFVVSDQSDYVLYFKIISKFVHVLFSIFCIFPRMDNHDIWISENFISNLLRAVRRNINNVDGNHTP